MTESLLRKRAAWLVTVPIALVGVEAAHALANRAFGSPEGPAELFAGAASGAELAPVLGAVAAAAVLIGLACRVTGRWSPTRGARLLAFPFACLPPVAFVLLEVMEGLLHRGVVPWGDALEPTFLVGLVLQIPFALAGYLVARLLLRLSDRLRALVARRPAPALALPPCLFPVGHTDCPRLLPRGPRSPRAPPVALPASR